ncbi:hypothetical protein VUR80DRAFT_4129 [Thermomyces stellatus]
MLLRGACGAPIVSLFVAWNAAPAPLIVGAIPSRPRHTTVSGRRQALYFFPSLVFPLVCPSEYVWALGLCSYPYDPNTLSWAVPYRLTRRGRDTLYGFAFQRYSLNKPTSRLNSDGAALASSSGTRVVKRPWRSNQVTCHSRNRHLS